MRLRKCCEYACSCVIHANKPFSTYLALSFAPHLRRVDGHNWHFFPTRSSEFGRFDVLTLREPLVGGTPKTERVPGRRGLVGLYSRERRAPRACTVGHPVIIPHARLPGPCRR